MNTLDDSTSPAAVQLRGMLDGETPVYLLIDPLGGEPLDIERHLEDGSDVQAARSIGWDRPVTPVILHTSVPLPAYQHPYLVTLSSKDDELLAITLGLAEAEQNAATGDGLSGTGAAHHRIAGWLQSPFRADQLAARLSELMRLRLHAPTDLTYLRLADRRTLGLLRHVLGAGRLETYLPAIERWCYLDVTGDLVRLAPGAARYASLVLTRKQWDTMTLAEAINRTVAKWIGERGRCSANVAVSDLYARTIQAILDARPLAGRFPHRFVSAADLSTWCALTLDIPSLPVLPEVLALLAQQGSEDDPAEPVRYLHTQLRALAKRG